MDSNDLSIIQPAEINLQEDSNSSTESVSMLGPCLNVQRNLSEQGNSGRVQLQSASTVTTENSPNVGDSSDPSNDVAVVPPALNGNTEYDDGQERELQALLNQQVDNDDNSSGATTYYASDASDSTNNDIVEMMFDSGPQDNEE